MKYHFVVWNRRKIQHTIHVKIANLKKVRSKNSRSFRCYSKTETFLWHISNEVFSKYFNIWITIILYIIESHFSYFKSWKSFPILKGTTRMKVALGKNFEQSSTVGRHTAERAIDNLRKSYSETNKEAEAWWRVDLGTPKVIDEVRYLSSSRSEIHATIISFVVSIGGFVKFSFCLKKKSWILLFFGFEKL